MTAPLTPELEALVEPIGDAIAALLRQSVDKKDHAARRAVAAIAPHIDRIRAEERERCAKVADDFDTTDYEGLRPWLVRDDIAAAIRGMKP